MEKALDENGPEYQAHLETTPEAEQAVLARHKYVAEGLCRKEKVKASVLNAEEDWIYWASGVSELNKRPTGVLANWVAGGQWVEDYGGESKSSGVEPADGAVLHRQMEGVLRLLFTSFHPCFISDDLDDFDSPPMFDDPDFRSLDFLRFQAGVFLCRE